ncbi:SGNH/GDSL hydrolase family protein [Agaribacter flavus]|uniref:SGNH/GDSL hydrolase family protein n=1 Tax=Agaribacter flavus TaxID=1902781 RepID=A0ABV7FPW5_9ALTE
MSKFTSLKWGIFGLIFCFVIISEGRNIWFFVSGEARKFKTPYIEQAEHYKNHKTRLESRDHSSSQDAIFLGDSILFSVGEDYFYECCKLDILNSSIPSETSLSLLQRIQETQVSSSAMLYVHIGTNDIGRNIKLETVINQIETIFSLLEHKDITIISVIPSNNFQRNNNKIKNLNAKMLALANNLGYRYLDVWPALSFKNKLRDEYSLDGLHLNDEGRLVMQEIIANDITTR